MKKPGTERQKLVLSLKSRIHKVDLTETNIRLVIIVGGSRKSGREKVGHSTQNFCYTGGVI